MSVKVVAGKEVVDTETGEVVEKLDDLADKWTEGANQLTLFEGHEISMIEQRLKPALIATEVVDASTVPPKLYEKKYFIVEVKASKVSHGDKDGVLKKTVDFDVTRAAEVSEFNAKRILGQESG